MSEQGWRAFLAADGLDDWVVLHGGAAAVFRVPPLAGNRVCIAAWPDGAGLPDRWRVAQPRGAMSTSPSLVVAVMRRGAVGSVGTVTSLDPSLVETVTW